MVNVPGAALVDSSPGTAGRCGPDPGSPGALIGGNYEALDRGGNPRHNPPQVEGVDAMREWTEKHIRELIDDEYRRLKKDDPGPGPDPGSDKLKEICDSLKGRTLSLYGIAPIGYPVTVWIDLINYKFKPLNRVYWERDVRILVTNTIPSGLKDIWFSTDPTTANAYGGYTDLTPNGMFFSGTKQFPNGVYLQAGSQNTVIELGGQQAVIYPDGSGGGTFLSASQQVPAGTYRIHFDSNEYVTTFFE